MQSGRQIMGYCEPVEKQANPFSIPYLGSEKDADTLAEMRGAEAFVAIGHNGIRKSVQIYLRDEGQIIATLIHPAAIISPAAQAGAGTLVMAGVMVNALAVMGEGVILNTGCIIEHECRIGDFAHIAPGAVLTGNVTVGEGAFVGANAVVKEGVTIGDNAIIGAGTVVVKDVPPGSKVAGNPQRELR
jgi:sugar O-acyltransferase (sialic acid O-acetyltransferase NeuD family)